MYLDQNLWIMKSGWMIILVCLFQSAKAQLQQTIPGTSIGAYSNKGDLFSSFYNVASLASLQQSSVMLYTEKKFLLKELGHYRFIAGSGNFAVHAVYAGFSGYNEMQAGLAYARKLGREIDIGLRFNYNAIRIGGYGKAAAIGFEAGTIFHLSEKLQSGIHVSNPAGGKFGNAQKEKLASVYSMGFGYDVSPKFFLNLLIDKEENQPVNFSPAFLYKAAHAICIKAGLSTASTSAWMGVMLLWNKMSVDIMSAYHPQLGFTPALLFNFSFTAKNKEEKQTAE